MATYDQLYPYYFEICALSQIRPVGKPVGGRAGHAVLYLKGARRRKNSPFPLLEMCDERSADLGDPESGVGVSVDKIFRSVNWVAIPGKRLFFQGNLSAGAPLTEAHRDATVRSALDLRLFRGVEIHDEYLEGKPADQGLEEFVAAECLGTDYGLNFGRTVFSCKLPVTRAMVSRMIAFLNDLNQKYASDRADYNWSGYHDNCIHTIHNAVAAAGVWKPKPVAGIKLSNFFKLTVPANEFIKLATLANDFPLESFTRIYFDRVKRAELWKYGWLPTRHGALLETIPVHADNALYDTGFRMLVLEPALIFARNRRRGMRMLAGKRYTDLEENLRFFKGRYVAILESRQREPDPTPWEMRFWITRRKYYAYIEEQLDDVNEKLAKVSA